MRHPKELREPELQRIAYKVREKVLAEFGLNAYTKHLGLGKGSDFGLFFIRQTYLAVREELEREHDATQGS